MLHYFPIICDVPNVAVIFIEFIACFLVMAYKFFFKPLFTIPEAYVFIGMILHYVIQIRFSLCT